MKLYGDFTIPHLDESEITGSFSWKTRRGEMENIASSLVVLALSPGVWMEDGLSGQDIWEQGSSPWRTEPQSPHPWWLPLPLCYWPFRIGLSQSRLLELFHIRINKLNIQWANLRETDSCSPPVKTLQMVWNPGSGFFWASCEIFIML